MRNYTLVIRVQGLKQSMWRLCGAVCRCVLFDCVALGEKYTAKRFSKLI